MTEVQTTRTRMVLLRHVLSDGSAHFDWMLEGTPGSALVTFRVQARVDDPGVEEFVGVRLADHRASYLEYEGPVSGGRGEVQRVARGVCSLESEGGGFRVEVWWEGNAASRRWIGMRGDGEGEWRFWCDHGG